MANKTFNTRVKNKRDTAANWEAVATTFQPLDGELIIVDTSAGKTRFKVGRYDTAKGRLLYYNEIPFADEYLYNDLNESQGKIYDKLKGIDDKSIIEMTLEPSTGTAAVKQYNIGIWQFPKTGFYKIKLSQLGTNITFLRLYARKTKDDGTLPEDDFSNDNLVLTSGAGGDGQLEYIYILADYLDIDSLTAYKIQFLNPILKQGITWVNTYDKTTQKWSFASAANVNAKNVSSNLTLTKGDTKTVYDGSVAREISIPTKTSELTNDSFVSYAEQVLTKDQQNQAKTNLGIDVLTGNTTAITPTQVKEAILAGRPVSITYTDTTYGNLTFTSFGYSLENNVVVANLVSTYNTQYILADLVGMSNNDQWILNTTELGTSTDIDNLILNIANNYVKYSETQTIPDEQKAQARTNIGAISSSEVSSNYLSLDDTQELTEIQQNALKNKLGYINNLKVLSNWIEATEQCKKESGHVLVIQNDAHNDGDIVPDVEDGYPVLLIPARIRGTNQVFYAIDAYGNNYTCSFSYSSFKFNVTKNALDQQTMLADPTEDMQIATKKYVDNSSVQPDWNQNDETAKDYIKNRICYKTPDELLGDITFTATSANAMTHTNTDDDMALLAKIQQLTGKGKVIKAIVDGQSCVFDANFDRGNFYFHGEFIGSVYYNTGRDWDITINNTAVLLTTGQTYTVQFYYIGNIVKIPDEYLSDKVFTHPVSRGDGSNSVIEGSSTKATGNDAHAEGYGTIAQGYYSHAEGYETVASGEYSHAEGKTSQATGSGSHAEGINYSTASGVGSHAEGYSTKAVGDYSHAEGYSTKASKVHSHAEGRETQANGENSHAEGYRSIATGNNSHAEGDMTRANGDASHAEGVITYANGMASHAEGEGCYASSNHSHAEGNNTIAYGESSHSQGKYNIKDDSGLLAHIVGNGKDLSSRSNAHTLDWSGNAWYSGDVYVGSTSGTNKDEGSKKLATEEYVNNHSTTITIDTELSTTSTNAIQNKAVKTAIDSLQTAVDSKVDITALNYGLTQVINDVAANYVKFTAEQTLTDEQKAQVRDNINAPSPADAVYTATAASTDGVAYTATVSGIDSLTVGASFIMIPNKASTSKAPTLNVNGLGAKPIRRRLSSLTTSLQQGYSTNWIALNKPFTVVYDGTAWVIEGLTKTDGADVYGAVAQATADAKGNNIADTYATIAMLQSLLPKVTTITLTSNWVGDASPYYQDIALSCVTETSIVDLQPTPEQLNSWQDDGIAFTTLSGNGTVRVYVAGGKPSSAISVQVRVQEVTVI